MTPVHLPFCFWRGALSFWYIELLLCRVWHLCDLPCGVYTLFRLISIARYICFEVSKCWLSRGKVKNIPWTCFNVDIWKSQAGCHVMSPCRRSLSGRKDLLLSLPTGVLSLPLAMFFFFIFSCAVFRISPLLTERPKEATAILNIHDKDQYFSGNAAFKCHLMSVWSATRLRCISLRCSD